MPRNNSKSRREQRRQTIAVSKASRRNGASQYGLFDAVAEILDNAADELMGRDVDELMRQREHQCGNEANCTLPPKTCSALNQCMPPHMIVGQRPA
jgi:hypothetical protein